MTLNALAKELNTSTKELKILMSSKPDIFNTHTYFENGEIQLEKIAEEELKRIYTSEKDKTYVTFENISDVLDVPVEVIANTITSKNKLFKGSLKASPNGRMETNMFKCKMLTELIFEITDSNPISLSALPNTTLDKKTKSNTTPENESVVDATKDETKSDDNDNKSQPTNEEPIVVVNDKKESSNEKTPTETKRVSRNKKQKYTMTMQTLTDKLTSATTDISQIRMFLLSLPDYSIEDIAIMSDETARNIFENNYIAMTISSGTIIIDRKTFKELVNTKRLFFVENS